MISQKSLDIVEATVEVVRENGLAITSTFYSNLLTAHPELKNLFNMSSQANGEQQQALASAVYAYAANINKPAVLEPVLNRIAHKHASLGIKPAQYTVVGRHLMSAIKKVLGEAATDDIMAAWDEVYWLLACDLVAREATLYAQKELDDGHWLGLKVIKVVKETDQTNSLYLSRVDGLKLPNFHAGQYISVAMEENGFTQIRQYSLSDTPDQDMWRITVKKEEAKTEPVEAPSGYLSNRIHNLKEGDLLRGSYPYGDFILSHDDEAVVMLSAGVGITPMVSMLKSLAEKSPEKSIHFYHAAQSAKHVALASDVNLTLPMLKDCQHGYFYQEAECADEGNNFQGYMDLSQTKVTDDIESAKYYLCGPVAFMRQQRKYLQEKGVPAEKIQYEVFGSDLLVGLN